MIGPERDKLAQRFSIDEEMQRALREAVRTTVAEHKRRGNSIVVWKDGRPVWIPARDIRLEEEN
jgi:hypothetical protein